MTVSTSDLRVGCGPPVADIAAGIAVLPPPPPPPPATETPPPPTARGNLPGEAWKCATPTCTRRVPKFANRATCLHCCRRSAGATDDGVPPGVLVAVAIIDKGETDAVKVAEHLGTTRAILYERLRAYRAGRRVPGLLDTRGGDRTAQAASARLRESRGGRSSA